MKMIIAINNKKLSDRIAFHYASKYSVYIIDTKELIISSIEANEEYILVIRYDLKGEIDFFDFINIIKKINSKIRIVVLVKVLNQELKEQLFSKEIFNIIEGNNFLFEELIDNIDTPKMIVYKTDSLKNRKSNLVFITGISCSGKTTLSHVISTKIASNGKSVLVIDMDFITPSLDLYLSGIKNYSLVDYIRDVIDFKIKKMECYETVNEKYKNLKYILNCKSIGIPKEELIINMIENLKEKYEYVIIDTSSLMINQMYRIANKLNGNIVFVMEPTKKCIRTFDINTSTIDRNILIETKIVINKYSKNKKMLEYIEKHIPLEIYGRVNNVKNINKYNEKNNIGKIKCNLNKLLKNIGIIKFEKWTNRLLEKIFKFEEE